jgi:basic amino acid/polyamine antiporter, APA family
LATLQDVAQGEPNSPLQLHSLVVLEVFLFNTGLLTDQSSGSTLQAQLGVMRTIESGKAPGLVRGLGLWAVTAIVIGAMIGQAIFLVTSQMARDLGSEIRVLAVWIIGGVVLLLGAFCYAELGAAMPEAGGEYVYLSRGLGPVWGFLYGWTSALIMRPGSAATIAAGFLRFTGFLLPSVATPIFTFQPYQFTFTVSLAKTSSAMKNDAIFGSEA